QANTPWRWKPAPSNAVAMRLEVVRNALSRLVDGAPGLLISPTCTNLRRALAGGYRFRQVNVGSGVAFSDSPEKNDSSHIADALQYGLSGAGEQAVVLQRQQRRLFRPTQAIVEYDIFGSR